MKSTTRTEYNNLGASRESLSGSSDIFRWEDVEVSIMIRPGHIVFGGSIPVYSLSVLDGQYY